jgi:hypothetical protein
VPAAAAALRLRFGNPTDDYMGLNSAPYKQPVHVQLSLFKNRQHGVAPLKNGHVLDILEQLTLCRWGVCSAVLTWHCRVRHELHCCIVPGLPVVLTRIGS